MIIIKCCTGEYGTVRVESGVGNRGRPVMMEEARVRFIRGQISAIHIERLDFVAVGAPG